MERHRIGIAGSLALVACTALGLLGCNEIDPVPTPSLQDAETGNGGAIWVEPPVVAEDRLVISASRSARNALVPDGSGIILVAGLPGALLEADRAIVRNVATTAAADVPVNPDGSFAAVLPAAADDAIAVLGRKTPPEGSPVDGEPVVVVVPEYQPELSPHTPAGPADVTGSTGTITVSLVGTREAEVIGSWAAVAPGTEVIVADPAISTIATGAALDDGSFTLRIEARPGDGLVLFSRRLDARAGTAGSASDAVALEVPLL